MSKLILLSACAFLVNLDLSFAEEFFMYSSTYCSEAILIPNTYSNADMELIEILIKYGNNSDGIPALHYAIKVGDERAVGLLLDHGADVNAKTRDSDNRSLTALDCAAASGHLNIINLLIERGAQVRFTDPQSSSYYNSPIWFAIINDRANSVECLIYHGALGTIYDPTELRWLLSSAVDYGSINVLKWFKSVGVNYRNHIADQGLLLERAITSNQPSSLRFLLDEGIDVNTRIIGSTALHTVSAWKRLECVKVLIEHGADVNLIDKNGYSPLESALCGSQQQVGMFHVIKALVDAGANVNHKVKGNLPLIIRTTLYFYNHPKGSDEANEYEKCVEYLVNKGANINATDVSGKNALYYARQSKNTDLIEWLSTHGAKD